ncbi:hypothetical protein L6452_04642 [Arctium lappa]|uniref:Uncharacterized protein n=1 Tax=Arctium lappa TaxID=4217 RepID=A0ACB9EDS8_ARCLA|nr:hypothetical protein L6452_04642 [Arctium lappa]
MTGTGFNTSGRDRGSDTGPTRLAKQSGQTLQGRYPARLCFYPILVTSEKHKPFPAIIRHQTTERDTAKGGNEKNVRSSVNQTNPEAEERKRLRKLAISKNLLSEAPAKASLLSLNPSKTVSKHHGVTSDDEATTMNELGRKRKRKKVKVFEEVIEGVPSRSEGAAGCRHSCREIPWRW